MVNLQCGGISAKEEEVDFSGFAESRVFLRYCPLVQA